MKRSLFDKLQENEYLLLLTGYFLICRYYIEFYGNNFCRFRQ